MDDTSKVKVLEKIHELKDHIIQEILEKRFTDDLNLVVELRLIIKKIYDNTALPSDLERVNAIAEIYQALINKKRTEAEKELQDKITADKAMRDALDIFKPFNPGPFDDKDDIQPHDEDDIDLDKLEDWQEKEEHDKNKKSWVEKFRKENSKNRLKTFFSKYIADW